MIKPIRKPIVSTVLLLAVITVIYIMSTSSQSTLGANSPIGMKSSSPGLQNQDPSLNDRAAELDISAEPSKPDSSLQDGLKQLEVDDDAKDVKNSDAEQDPEFKIQPIGQINGITDTPFMPKMANETLKAQLGNAAWRLLHTILARYPEKPTDEQQNTLYQYIQYFGQVYPCGDCARHFQGLLKKFPPQVRSRKTAALWGCFIHNKVNERLEKPEYDCTTILEDYDCGCGDDEKEADDTLGNQNIKEANKANSKKEVNQIVMEEEEDSQLGG